MAETKIEWSDSVWNPVAGCRRVSPGCEHCYAETMAHRLAAMGQKRYLGLVSDRGRWTGEARLVPEVLDKPLRWRKPRLVFVNSMSDLFHEDVPFEYIAAVFGVMAACPQHTFQVLTKRPERAVEFFEWLGRQENAEMISRPLASFCCRQALRAEVEYHPLGDGGPLHTKVGADPDGQWPLPNVWIGISAEDQRRADERIPLLLQCPAAVRFVSAEPLLGGIDFMRVQWPERHAVDVLSGGAWTKGPITMAQPGDCFVQHSDLATLDWVIVGGESGHGARPCNAEWIRSIVRQCEDGGVPVFVKQLGSNAVNRHRARIEFRDRKGADPAEWPEDMRVRQWPEARS